MTTPNSKQYKTGMIRYFYSVLATLLAFSPLQALAALEQKGYAKPWQHDFQPAATPVMEKLIGLHDFLLVVISVVTVIVLGLLVYVCVRFSRKNNPEPSKTTHNTLIEVIWTVVPVLILIGIAIPSLRTFYYMEDASLKPDMTLKVTGYQWYWGYEYPDQDGLAFESYIKKDDELDKSKGDVRLLSVDKPLVVPVDTTVRVLVTSADVIHAWAMPAFGVKTDAVPGRINQTWFNVKEPGIYYGQCSELCGVSHGFMPIEIRAVEKDVFNAWVARAKDGEYSLDGLELPSEETAEAPPEETKDTPAGKDGGKKE